ncbi:conserved hypothetical protein [Candidatus Terasakiella magnetica]|nr:conserved hypothetical protein [Candidatus Terasakiella magnetica]
MSRLMADWRERKGKEDEQLHDQLKAAILSGRVQVFTDPRVLDFPGSPVHQHWDHLLPLTALMTLALIILLATNVLVGIVVMTLCTLAHLFGNKYYVGWRLKTRALAYMADNTLNFQTLWQMGGVAMVMKDGNEPPCLAPKGDWRKFIRRNLGEGESPRSDRLVHAPVPTAHPVSEVMTPPPTPLADSFQPDIIEIESEPEAAPVAHPQPGEKWDSVTDRPPHDEVVPDDSPSGHQ